MADKPKTKPTALVIGLTIFGCLLVLFFGMRTFRAFKKFNGPPQPPPFAEELETNVELIEDWMTVPFISHTYGVPPETLMGALNIPMEGNHKKSLKELNEEYYPASAGFVLETVKATILAHQTPPEPNAPIAPDAPPTATLQAAPTP